MVTGMCVQQFKSISLTDDFCLDVYFVFKVTVFAISHTSYPALPQVRGRRGERFDDFNQARTTIHIHNSCWHMLSFTLFSSPGSRSLMGVKNCPKHFFWQFH